jgi:hypothetical protein
VQPRLIRQHFDEDPVAMHGVHDNGFNAGDLQGATPNFGGLPLGSLGYVGIGSADFHAAYLNR